MNRNYTSEEIFRIVEYSLEAQANLLPFCCKENIDCWWVIKCCIEAVKKYNVIPELYWHGSSSEYKQLLILLSDGYPRPSELLRMAEGGTTYEIENVAKHFHQYIGAMFELVKTHHGYVVLKPTAYMENLYPNSKGMLYVYTSDKWAHSERSDIDGTILTFKAEELGNFPQSLKKKLGII